MVSYQGKNRMLRIFPFLRHEVDNFSLNADKQPEKFFKFSILHKRQDQKSFLPEGRIAFG